jgi:8-oxo-dGTP pyrophosphatase MutT (NUDIX family)
VLGSVPEADLPALSADSAIMSAPIRDASTVLPLRNGPEGLEVYMVKRNSRLGFLGGAHVFPGGAVDEADRYSQLDERLEDFDPSSARDLLMAEREEHARGFYVAAFRELFEEAGILLARAEAGEWVDLCSRPEVRDRFARHREGILAGDLDFHAMLASEGLTLACGALRYFAHWITPALEKKRFDTRFFLARMPEAQEAEHVQGELTEGAWTRPGEGLDAYGRREIEMVPPTICSLDWLALYATVEEALEAALHLEIVTIRPKIAVEGESVTLLYPGDEDYDAGVARECEPGRMLNRLVLRHGIWVRPGG